MADNWLEKYRLERYSVSDEGFERSLYVELVKALDQYGISPSEYALDCPDAGGVGGKLCLHREDAFWVVYVSERGERYNPVFFASAWDASNYLIWSLVSTANSHQGFPRFNFDPMKWR